MIQMLFLLFKNQRLIVEGKRIGREKMTLFDRKKRKISLPRKKFCIRIRPHPGCFESPQSARTSSNHKRFKKR
jgi:hypothetical protein